MQENRPRWQAHACPEWCDGGHQEDDHVDDRLHSRIGETTAITVISNGQPVVDELEVALWRRDGEAQTWLYMGFGGGREIDVAVADVNRVLASILEVLGVHPGDGQVVLDAATMIALTSPPRELFDPAD